MTEKEINKLVSDNINYVKSVANHYRGNGVDFDDLVSEGTLAMLTAAQKYDAERGSQFVAYASPFHSQGDAADNRQAGSTLSCTKGSEKACSTQCCKSCFHRCPYH